MACPKNHAVDLPRDPIEALQDSQAGFWRHKCAGCAYDLGRRTAEAAEARLRERIRTLEVELAAARGART